MLTNQLIPPALVLSKTKISMGQLQKIEEPLILRTRIFRMQSLTGIGPLQDMFSFSCRFTKNWVLAWQFTKFWVMMSQGRFAKFQLEMASISKVKLKLLRFLKGIGGILIWFFLAGILMTEVSSSGLQRSLMQMIWGTSHLAQMGRQTGVRLSSCTSRKPSMTQLSLTGGILTATLTCALSFFLILNLTSQKYSNRSLLLTEKTYSSRSLNSLLLQRAMTRSMKGLAPLSSMISSLSPIEMSNSSIDPGNRVDLPNMMLVRLISTKYLVSVSSVESSSFAGSTFEGLSAGESSMTSFSQIIFSTTLTSSSAGSGQSNKYLALPRLESTDQEQPLLPLSRSSTLINQIFLNLIRLINSFPHSHAAPSFSQSQSNKIPFPIVPPLGILFY